MQAQEYRGLRDCQDLQGGQVGRLVLATFLMPLLRLQHASWTALSVRGGGQWRAIRGRRPLQVADSRARGC